MTQILRIDFDRLPQFKKCLGVGSYGYIESAEHYLVINAECIHWVLKQGIPIHIQTLKRIQGDPKHLNCVPIEVPHAALKRSLADPIIDIPCWVHSFGVKSRIEHNYALLQGNCRRLNIQISFPEWRMK